MAVSLPIEEGYCDLNPLCDVYHLNEFLSWFTSTEDSFLGSNESQLEYPILQQKHMQRCGHTGMHIHILPQAVW